MEQGVAGARAASLTRQRLGRGARDPMRRAGWAVAVLSCTGLVLLLIGVHLAAAVPPAPEPAPAAGSSSPASGGAATGGMDTATQVPAASSPVPVRLDIPRIGVHSEVISLGLNPDGTVAVPPLETGAPAGWYRYLAVPGEPGPAVLLGHVDTYQGPAVFSRLHELEPGDAITVQRSDGRAVQFTVDSVRSYVKSEFPTQAVYGWTAAPVLRLVTCGGAFDRSRRSYLSNVVVYASLAAGSPGNEPSDSWVTRAPETGLVPLVTGRDGSGRDLAPTPRVGPWVPVLAGLRPPSPP